MYCLSPEDLVSEGAVALIARRQNRLKEKDKVLLELREKYGMTKDSAMVTPTDSESEDSEIIRHHFEISYKLKSDSE